MSEGRLKWSEVSETEVGVARQEPVRRVAGPAIALIVLACLGLASNCLVWLGLAAFRKSQEPSQPPPGLKERHREDYERGRAAAPCIDCCLVAVPTLAVYPLILTGGILMQRLRARWLAITAARMAMLPCSPVFLVGLPLGIWAIVVLLDPDVGAAFGQ